jgi:uncharacterized protein YwgA
MERKDWTLLAISFAEGEPMSPVQLQKTLFLLGRNFPSEVGQDFYEFTPHYYGPFSATIYDDAAQLAADGLVRVERQPWRSWAEYTATPRGMARAGDLNKHAPPQAVLYLKATVDWARSLSFQQLVSAIYKRYPDQRANSVFQG